MSKTIIQKNIKLSLEFDTYISKHPSVFKSLPRGVNVIMTSSSDKKLSEANRSIAKSSRSGKFVEAYKSSKGWIVRPVSV